MLGDSITGRSLLNAKPEVWKHVWFKKMHRGCVINKVTNVEGVVGYVSFHNTPAERFELVNPYNTKLLKRMAAGRQNPSIKMKRVYPINDYRAWAKYEARGVN